MEFQDDLVERVLNSGSVAIVGASERANTKSVITNLTKGRVGTDHLYLINPNRDTVFGLPCVPSLSDLATPPDLVCALVTEARITSVVEECGAVGVSACIVSTGGFADIGYEGKKRQDELAKTAADCGVTLLGPNTFGISAPGFDFEPWSGISPIDYVVGSTSLVAQSSGMLNLVLPLAAFRTVGLRAIVSVGNEAMIDASDVLKFYARDEERAVGVILESASRPRKLVSALRDVRAAGKPIIVLKFGHSQLGRQNTLSHSGRLASQWSAWQALFDKVGATVVRSLDELVNALTIVPEMEPLQSSDPENQGLAFVTNSGGDCGLISDMSEQMGITVAQPTPATVTKMKEFMGSEHSLANPLDTGNLASRMNAAPDVFEGAIDTLASDPHVGIILARLTTPWQPDQESIDVYMTIHNAAIKHGKAFAVVSRAAEPFDRSWFQRLRQEGIACAVSYESTLHALAGLLNAQRWSSDRASWPTDAIPELAVGAEGAERKTRSLDADEAEEWLRTADLPYVQHGNVVSAAEAVRLAGDIGFPVCVKAIAPGLVHKADAGGVELGLGSGEEVELACNRIQTSVTKAGYELTGFEVQAMVQTGIEVMVGAFRDPVLGPVLTLGWGGTEVELINDIGFLLPPAAPEEVQSVLDNLRIGKLLERLPARDGYIEFTKLVSRFASRVAESPELESVDLNPIIVAADNAVIVDSHVSVYE